MSEKSKVYTVTSKSFGKELGRFHAQKVDDKFVIYNGIGEIQGRFDSFDVADKVAKNLAYQRMETLKIRLNGIDKPSFDEMMADEAFMQKNMTCMIGGFYIVNSHPTKKCFYLSFDKHNEIKYMYPTYKAAFADLITLHKAQDFEVVAT